MKKKKHSSVKKINVINNDKCILSDNNIYILFKLNQQDLDRLQISQLAQCICLFEKAFESCNRKNSDVIEGHRDDKQYI